MWWGILPGLIAFAVVAAALTAVALNASWLGDRVTQVVVAPDSTAGWGLSLVLAVGVFAGSALIAAYTFTALTLFIGQPFFERISHRVDAAFGAPDVAHAEPWWRSMVRGVAEAARIVALSAIVGIGLWMLALVPVVGTVTAVVLGVLFGGWILSLELTAHALSRRGVLALHDRRRLLGEHRHVAVGFGGAVFLLFLIPFGSVIAMPAAVVGATLLTRSVLGESMTAQSPDALGSSEDSPQITGGSESP